MSGIKGTCLWPSPHERMNLESAIVCQIVAHREKQFVDHPPYSLRITVDMSCSMLSPHFKDIPDTQIHNLDGLDINQ
jgi:hypothetical protein